MRANAPMSEALAGAGINLQGLSAAAMGKCFVCFLAFDRVEDAALAAKAQREC